MGMKRNAVLMAQLALLMLEPPSGRSSFPDAHTGLNEDVKERHKENLKKKGVQEYTIMGVTVYARNYKNALKKAERIYFNKNTNP